MRSTCLGARSGRSSMTTRPLVVSMTMVFSGSAAMRRSFRTVIRDADRAGDYCFASAAICILTILSGSTDRAVVGLRTLLDLVDNVHAGRHLAEDGVLAVERWRGREHDEELRIGGVRVGRTGHADRAAHEMRLVGELGRQVGQVRAASAGAGRIAGLRHEAVDDAMEHDAVIKALLRQRLDLRDVLGREVGP